MEPPRGLWASLWSFIRFLPFFIGLLILGFIKGGAAYGLLAPMFATFQAVEEGKTNKFYHCICDGIWSTVKSSFTIIRDFLDVCFFSYFSIMDDLRRQGPPEGKYYEISNLFCCDELNLVLLLHSGIKLYSRFQLNLPPFHMKIVVCSLALIGGILGSMIDLPVISVIAMCKSPYMLFKGWHRLFHDCIGREGPFLETICVPFAESSFWFGLCYVVASLSIYDEYSNDILDMPEGSCFPRPRYTKKTPSRTTSLSASFSRPSSFKNPPSRTSSINAPMLELKPLELADALFKECQHYGEAMVLEGLITLQDIEDAKINKDCGGVISIGLPAYSLLQALLRSAKADSNGILLSDNVTEITSSNRPKDTFFDWFLNPLLIIKDQIKADNLSESEEDYLGKLVLLSGDPTRLKTSNIGPVPESELRQAELTALARRLRGITKSISRYPTFRRRFDSSIKYILEELAKKNGGSRKSVGTGPQTVPRSRSMLDRLFSQKSFKGRTNGHGSDQETQTVFEGDIEIR
ncbi:hypothetical protein DH2020_012767 [Rehmannia glutinosa]|uniref:Uncharacterized protein n=1 Tax=Rehmannia glutinosa TaxID=99300 RepID=A0ABR0X0B6_REHGL